MRVRDSLFNEVDLFVLKEIDVRVESSTWEIAKRLHPEIDASSTDGYRKLCTAHQYLKNRLHRLSKFGYIIVTKENAPRKKKRGNHQKDIFNLNTERVKFIKKQKFPDCYSPAVCLKNNDLWVVHQFGVQVQTTQKKIKLTKDDSNHL